LILVTGSTGYIGSQIVSHLLQEPRLLDYTIRCTVRDLSNRSKLEPLENLSATRLEFVKCDLMDDDSI